MNEHVFSPRGRVAQSGLAAGVASLCAAWVVAVAGWSGCGSSPRPVDRGIADTEPRPGQPAAEDDTADRRAIASPPMNDDAITQVIGRKVLFDPGATMSNIQITTTEGIVELSGQVDNALARERLTRLAEEVKGVRGVRDEIQVVPPVQRPGEELRRDVEAALLLDAATEVLDVSVEAAEGRVTLGGAVGSYADRELVERVVKGVRGVAEVENELEIRYGVQVSDRDIQRAAWRRLRNDALVGDAMIAVDVDGGEVRLSGVVGSAAERSRAHADAWVVGVNAVNHEALEVRWWASDEALRGTKDAPRADAVIAGAVAEALTYEPRVRSLQIRPEVVQGVVILRGAVDNLKARTAAEHAARHVVGVANVDNRLAVRPRVVLPDNQVMLRVLSALALGPLTQRYDIDVRVDDGRVRLRGAVGSFFEKAEAEDAALGIRGVTALDNELSVENGRVAFVFDPYLYPYHPLTRYPAYVPERPARGDDEIRQAIEEEMFWSPFVDGSRVNVEVSEGRATLTGSVNTWREREAAAENAFEGGAIAVANELEAREAGAPRRVRGSE